MKNNFKFLIVLAILLAGCICVGSTFAADPDIAVTDVSVDNTQQNIEIAHDDSNQDGLNNLKAKSIDDNIDNNVPDKLAAEKSDVNVTDITGNSYGQNLTITAKVTDGATGNVTFIVKVSER